MNSLSRRTSAATIAAPLIQGQTRKPNVVFVLEDDWSWRDRGVNGRKCCETLDIDRLATRGMLFRNAHAAPPCSPTRAGTVLNPGRLVRDAQPCTVN
ncbi:MAG: sulfatase-like hydrolase/transferase [Acidobacteria bacterium]|nr:sulfatase-like hydrolase/transferase [Acidobacteriota bacterium]